MTPTIKCAEWSRDVHLDPVATIGCYSGYMLVEWPLPWPSELLDVPELSALRPQTQHRNIRVQGLVKSGADEEIRLIYYRQPGASFRGPLSGQELTVPRSDVLDAAMTLLEGAADAVPLPADLCDVLVCTHGVRDRCCGSSGTRLFMELEQKWLSDVRSVRVWRTSHTGGHRFAPTVILLPDATGWAFADMGILSQVLDRVGDIGEVLAHYRGFAGLPSPRWQALERRAISQVGFEAFDSRRSLLREAEDRMGIAFELPGGRQYRFEGTVTSVGDIALPTCGRASDGKNKTQPQWSIRDFSGASGLMASGQRAVRGAASAAEEKE